MSLSLGIDTGGTYTDAVIHDAARGVIAKAKALTTRHDLSIGLGEAMAAVIATGDIRTQDIGLVSISTTLATNALVEGQGGRIALVMIGFGETDLDKAGLRDALGGDPVVFVPGGHDAHGRAALLDLSALETVLDDLATEVSAFAIAGYFAVRNPEHEIAARDLIRAKTGLPVTASHELSAKLDGPRRALTTVLNARLISMIDRLIDAADSRMAASGIDAPLMVVRGDGSLVSAAFARQRPIETILSGPAASLVGARHLADVDDAIVSDIGGTTTDIAILDGGQPRIDPQGATVGGYRTMVDAVAMRTFGLGGDSEVAIEDGALRPAIRLGPRRLVPLSLLAHLHGETVIRDLDRQQRATIPVRNEGRFALRAGVPDRLAAGLTRSESDLFSRLTDAPQPLDKLLSANSELATLSRLAARGLVMVSGFTPSDAQHVLGRFNHWNTQAAALGAALFARKKDGYGNPLAGDAETISARVVDRLIRLSAERVLETAFVEDGLDGAASGGFGAGAARARPDRRHRAAGAVPRPAGDRARRGGGGLLSGRRRRAGGAGDHPRSCRRVQCGRRGGRTGAHRGDGGNRPAGRGPVRDRGARGCRPPRLRRRRGRDGRGRGALPDGRATARRRCGRGGSDGLGHARPEDGHGGRPRVFRHRDGDGDRRRTACDGGLSGGRLPRARVIMINRCLMRRL